MTEPLTIPTRQSLLARLKDCGDQEGWRQFFETYWRLIHATALKAGLTEVEAEEVVQEVMIAAVKKMPEFTYLPGKDSLKGWLLAVTRWKVGDQFRKRPPLAGPAHGPETPAAKLTAASSDDASTRTATAERLPDPRLDLEGIWDAEWHENLLRAALDRVKQTVNPAHYELYHVHVVQGLSVKETARVLGASPAAVYLAKHRIGRQLRAELRCLRNVGLGES